tara:strand:- start:3227 stop:3799 length:573 start_codon:yes stop_codon:yes gene_type:complete
MRFCSLCGSPTSLKIPSGDDLPRFVCDACNHIHYQNPKIVVGTIPQWKNHILLCRRAIDPGYGQWTLPGGFMENGETVEQGAIRETLEECGAEVNITSLFAVYSLPHISQVYMMFCANMRDAHFSGGGETLEVKLFRHDAIPWNALAFRVIHAIMNHYITDFAHNNFSIHIGTILPPSDELLSSHTYTTR